MYPTKARHFLSHRTHPLGKPSREYLPVLRFLHNLQSLCEISLLGYILSVR